MTEGRTRPAWAEIDLAAVRHNAGLLVEVVSPATLCAVVKADAYGHGAPAVARAALDGGAASLAVALVEEGVELRQAGITAPVFLLSEPPAGAERELVAAELTPTVASGECLDRLREVARTLAFRLPVHLKVDTGMHRLGLPVDRAVELAAEVVAERSLRLEGLWTHLAVADGQSAEDREFTRRQLDRFGEVLRRMGEAGIEPEIVHAGNSAGGVAWPEARYDLVRCGIALYGELPSPAMAGAFAEAFAVAVPGESLRPVLSLRARVTAVHELAAGERPSYGRLRPLPERSVVATVPLGYADGVPRALFAAGGTVLVGGRRCPLAGMVTMDQILVDCGPGAAVAPGDEVTLIGRQGQEEITVAEWARLLGTIGYEVLCGIGPRVPRLPVGGDGPPAGAASVAERGTGPGQAAARRRPPGTGPSANGNASHQS